MDYCSTCRRHLNGALVCPGCGAYAPDIAPPLPMAPAAPLARDPWDEIALPAQGPAAAPRAETDPMPAAPQGRAARRRQRARWKKNQRKAVVATAVALVGGGLTVASLNGQSANRAQATTAPDDTAMGVTQEQASALPTEASTPTAPPPSRPKTPTAPPTATNAPREQSVATTPSTAQPRTPTSPATTATSAAQSQPVTATIPEPTAVPATPSATATQPASPAPSPSATSPSGLCVLVLCVN
ncbi:SCO2400 family protein [Streptomyces sp. NPDC003635]